MPNNSDDDLCAAFTQLDFGGLVATGGPAALLLTRLWTPKRRDQRKTPGSA